VILVGQIRICRTYKEDTSSCMSFPRTILYFVGYQQILLNSEVAYSCCLVANPFNVSLSVMTRSGIGYFLYTYQFIEMQNLLITRFHCIFTDSFHR
jgi:hypothetical protein